MWGLAPIGAALKRAAGEPSTPSESRGALLELGPAAPLAAGRLCCSRRSRVLPARVKDKTAHPILTVTYLRKPIKQIAAAEELGLSYSTYRRRHAEAVTRLTEILWQRAVSPSS